MTQETGIQMKTMEEIAKEHFERQMELIRKRAAEDVQTDSIVGSCNCNVKTPDTQYHAVGCKYRLIVERDELRQRIADLERQLAEAKFERDNYKGAIETLESIRREQCNEITKINGWREELRMRLERMRNDYEVARAERDAANAEQAREIERLRERLAECADALEHSYDVTEWPANGESRQDIAARNARAALAKEEKGAQK